MFLDKLTKFLKYCNVRIVSEEDKKMEEKIERILKAVLKVQSSIFSKGNNDEFNNAIG